MDRKLWLAKYEQNLPPFTCPQCNVGRLAATKGIKYRTPEWLSDAYRNNDLQDMSAGRFHAFLVCPYENCGEISSVIGEFDSQTHFMGTDYNHNPIVKEDIELKIGAILPAPWIIHFSGGLTDVPRGHLVKSFELFWMDLGSCANRIRIVVETLLDQFGVVRQKTGANAKPFVLNLSQRIDELNVVKPGHGEALQALREVGNVGSHEGAVAFDDVLDCYELLEATLEELLDDKSAKLAAKAAAIRARRGRPAP